MTIFQKQLTYWNYQLSQFEDSRVLGIQTLAKSANQFSFATEYIDRNSNPSWKIQLAKGQDASTSYTRRGGFLDPALLVGSTLTVGPRVLGNPSYRITGKNLMLWPGPSIPVNQPQEDAALSDLALTRLKRKLSSQAGSFKALVPLAELRELRRTIVDTAHSSLALVHTLLNIRKTKRDAFKRASEAWLNWSFGISPTISDANKLINSIGSFLDRKDHNLRLTGIASKTWHTGIKGSVPGGQTGCYNAPVTGDAFSVHTLSYKYIAGFDLKLLSGNTYGISDHFGLELGELVPTFWELVPYSWLIDYFTTMGAFLDDAFTSPPGTSKYVVRCKRYTHKSDLYIRHTLTNSGEVYLTSERCVPGEYFWYEFVRTPLTSLPRTALRFKSLDEVGLNAVTRLLNLTSLLIRK